MDTYIEYRSPDVVHQSGRLTTRQFVCQQNISVDDSVWYNALRKKQWSL